MCSEIKDSNLDERRVVLTLDGGGTSFRFSATQGYRQIVDTVVTPSFGDNLERCLQTMVEGFEKTMAACPEPPVAISFAFPGPSPKASGIIGDLANLPAFRGGVPLGPMLEDHFGLPVFIQNDGDMFTFGEAKAGLLPWANQQLEKAGIERRFRNLLGVTLGTGLGAGLVSNGQVLMGDNAMSGEIWLMRNKRNPRTFAEEGASIRAVRRVYADACRMRLEDTPDPKTIGEIAAGVRPGNREGAIEAFRALGEVVGDAIANAITLFDALVVIGGGLTGSGRYFLPALVDELNSAYDTPEGQEMRRLTQFVHNLETDDGLQHFLYDDCRMLTVPRSNRVVPYANRRFTGVGLSRLETSRAIGIGSYSYALSQLDGLRTIHN